jgi:hypothetical protein
MSERSFAEARCRLKGAVLKLAAAAALTATPAVAQQVVISQVYGAGNNSGANWRNDFIELHNRGTTTVDLSTWSVQYASATGTTWSRTNLVGTIAPGGYYLIQQFGGTTNGAPLPTPDATGTIAMSATDGKVALVSNQTTLGSIACYKEGTSGVVDFVGFGTTNCYEGDGATGVLSATTACFRNGSGCDDSDNNNLDFTVATAAPRNSASPPVACTIVGACCTSGTCTTTTSGACTGTYQGDFTSCPEPVYAAPTTSGNTFEDISGTGTHQTGLPVGNDDGAVTVTLPWAFPLFGHNRTSISVGVNGFISMLPGTSATTFTNAAIPSTSTPNDIVAPLWDDLYMRLSTAKVFTEARTSPDRFIVQWDHVSTRVSSTATPDDLRFQAVLFMDGNIEFRYDTFTTTPTTAFSATVGVENQGGTVGTSIADTNVTGGSVTVDFNPPTSPLCSPPTNDGCAAATTLALNNVAIAGNTALASNDGTSSCDPTGNDVWYVFTTTSTGLVDLDTCGSLIDTVLTVYSGTCGSLTELACNDDCGGTPCGGTSSCLSSVLSAGTYYVRVSDKGAGGIVSVRGNFKPENDDCTGAITLAIPSSNAITYAGANNELASVPVCNGPEPGQSQSFTLTKGVWYKVNSATSQTITVDTLGGTADTKLWVYDGSAGCGSLVCVTANDDIEGSPFRSKLAFVAASGVDYYILLAPFSSTATTLTTVLTISADATPANDDCGSAEVISGGSGSTSGTTVGATGINQTTDLANPSCQSTSSGTAVFDVWYEYMAPCSANFTFHTCGSYDTILSVHTACPTASLSNQLTPTASSCNDDGASGCTPGSSVTVALSGGTTYMIRVVGKVGSAAGGSFTLTWATADSDGDGFDDCVDGCPLDPLKVAPGICGCGVPDTDSDGDGTPDCNDLCPLDPLKVAPGICGCGVPDTDSDGDGTPDCNDLCPLDPLKIAPGQCGCGVPDTDSDGDGTADCNDLCPLDPTKIAPGQCGCGVPDTDSDGDGTADCNDLCPFDPLKVAPGLCGCGVPDTDSDGDGTPDCNDLCPADPLKVLPGQCGCGVPDTDSDGDGTADCNDLCPLDPLKIAPGVCGCGVPDTDSDGDGVADCNDNCVSLPNPGQEDCDLDGIGDACELASGSQWDTDGNGIPDQCEGCPAIITYCTAGTTTNGCVPSISASGTPSAAATSGFVVTTTGLEGQRFSRHYYGITGPAAVPLPGGSTSYFCVKAPFQRTPIGNSGGTDGACDGTWSLDMLDYWANHPGVLGQPIAAGLIVNEQTWFRDPDSPTTTNLSNAIQYTLCP